MSEGLMSEGAAGVAGASRKGGELPFRVSGGLSDAVAYVSSVIFEDYDYIMLLMLYYTIFCCIILCYTILYDITVYSMGGGNAVSK